MNEAIVYTQYSCNYIKKLKIKGNQHYAENIVWKKIHQNINSFINNSLIILLTYPFTYMIFIRGLYAIASRY